ncbi:MAG: hypothetical protein ACTS3F_03255 [Phycisphaerales bacterium]
MSTLGRSARTRTLMKRVLATGWASGIVAAMVALGGCAAGDDRGLDEREAGELARQSEEVFGDPAGVESDSPDGESGQSSGSPEGVVSGGGAGAIPDSGVGGWGVLLATAAGENAQAHMEAQRLRLSELLGRRDVRVSRQRSGWAVVLGSYQRADDPGAQRDLAFVKEFRTDDGRRPFARAFLMPPGQRPAEPGSVLPGVSGSNEEWNLATVKERRGIKAAFTLQVGVFESVDRPQAMRAAENWVRELRKNGEEAFYYHGRHASMVAIGVFGREDWDALLDVASPRVRELQRRFPTTRLEVLDDRRGGSGDAPSAPPSTLVIIPEQ